MKGFNSDNHALNLPDSYKKTKDSNNYKILEIERSAVNKERETLHEIENSRDLDKAKGKTLDLYGEMVGQARGRMSDDQFLLLIKSRIMRNLSNGSYESIKRALCATFNCQPSDISIIEKDEPCVVQSISLPIPILAQAGMSMAQTTTLIKSLMPVGVTLETTLLEGTFMFSDRENEYDAEAGFCDVEGGTLGGYLGSLGEETNETILPI